MKLKSSYQSGPSASPLLGLTIADLFDQSAERFTDAEALVSKHQSVRMTYRDLRAECERFAQGLMSLGLNVGDRIGIWSPNCWEWIVVQIAAAKVGAILVNINPGYRASELEFALRQSACKIAVIAAPYKTSNYAEILSEICPELSRAFEGRLQSARLPDLETVIVLGNQQLHGTIPFIDVFEYPRDLSERQSQVCFESAANIQYTSGTTGPPKGATLSHHGIVNNAIYVAEKMRMSEKDRYCIPLPFYHCAGMIMGVLATFAVGAAAVIPAPTFDVQKTLEAIDSESCSVLGGVPTLFYALLGAANRKDFNLSSMRSGFIGGAPCPIEINRRIMTELHMPELTVVFGMTELSPIPLQTCMSDPLSKREGTVGRAHPHVEVKIVDPDTGKVVPIGVSGELCVRGYLVMLGYWANSRATRQSIDREAWLHSGDLAKMDEDGYVNIVGRIKDMLIRGGENIYPAEIEEMLLAHPKIHEAQVVGVPDEKYGEEIMAWVRPKEGQTFTTDELKDFFKGKITHFKIPRYWQVVDQFPMTVSGKVQKFKLRQRGILVLGLQDRAETQTS